MPEINVVDYLQSKGVEVKSATKNNIHTSCWFCGEDETKRGRLYINVDPTETPPGKFLCHLCGERGALNKIRRHFGDEPIQDDGEPYHSVNDVIFDERTNEILEIASEYYYTKLSENEKAFRYLKYNRGLNFETIERHRLGWADGSLGKWLSQQGYSLKEIQATGLVDAFERDFLYSHITIPYHVNGNVVLIRGKDINGKYLTPPGAKTRLFNTDSLLGAQTSCVVEGEFDAMIMEQLGFDAVGLPGANVWQDSMNGYFDDARRIQIILDNDDSGRAGSEKVAKALGTKARIVTTLLPETIKNEKNDISELVVNQGWVREDFEILFVKSRGGLLVSVDDAYQEWLEVQNAQGLKLGFPILDEQLHPGILPGQVVVILAKSGSGKSQPINSVLPTPYGPKTIGELNVGDSVFGTDGHPTLITGVYDRGTLDTYRVRFSDNTYLDVGYDHIWSVARRSGRRRTFESFEYKTTGELVKDLRTGFNGSEYKWIIPMTAPVNYSLHNSFLIGAYTLGSIIANGTVTGTSAVITTPDEEVIERIRSEGHECALVRDTTSNVCPRYTIRGLIGQIRKLNLDCFSYEKRIPQDYMHAATADRISLLQGLLDGGGSFRTSQGKTSIGYTTTSLGLAADIVELVNSLGGTATYTVSDRSGRLGRESSQPVYDMSIMLPLGMQGFSTSRKNAVAEHKNVTRPRRAIVSIDHVGSDEHKCIKVEAKDSLYLGSYNYIVTHNTVSLLNTFERMKALQPDIKILFVSLEQTRGDWFERAHRIHRFYDLQASFSDTLDFFRENITIIDKNRVSEEELIQSIEQYEYENGSKPDVVAVDYLGYWARSYSGESYERTSKAIMAMKRIAKDLRIPFLAPHQLSRNTSYGEEPDIDNARDSGVIVETADFVISLWSPDQKRGATREDRQGLVNAKIGKSRHGGVGTVCRLQFAPFSLVMVPEFDPYYEHAVDEHFRFARGDTYEQVVEGYVNGNRDLYEPIENEEEVDF